MVASLIPPTVAQAWRRYLHSQALVGQLLTWGFLHAKRSEHGAVGSVRLDDVEQAVFCAFVGKADDPMLQSVPKHGAWCAT